MSTENADSTVTWIRGPQLRKRWGDMPNSTFYDRLNDGRIPKPQYPFGPKTPFWSMADILQHEKAVGEAS